MCQGRGVRTCVRAGLVQASLCVNGVCGASDGRRLACVRVEGKEMRGQRKRRNRGGEDHTCSLHTSGACL